MEKADYSYITVLTNEKYIPGVRALAKSLRDVNSRYKLAILIPTDRYVQLMNNKAFCSLLQNMDNVFCMTAEGVELPKEAKRDLEKAGAIYRYWEETFFKLQVTGCTDYKKLVLLDSDMLILKNIDELFSRPHMSAVVAGECRHPEWVDLNSGLMVVEPSKKMNRELIEMIPATIRAKTGEGSGCGDQDVFHMWFPEWKEHKTLHLDEKYNLFFNDVDFFCKKRNFKIPDLAVIHFAGGKKPWMRSLFSELKYLTYMVIKLQFRQLFLWFQYRRLYRDGSRM